MSTGPSGISTLTVRGKWLKPSLSDAAARSAALEEADHRASATDRELNASRQESEAAGQAILQTFSAPPPASGHGSRAAVGDLASNSHIARSITQAEAEAEPSASLVRFHVGDDDGVSPVPEEVELTNVPLRQSTIPKQLPRATSSVIDLSSISEPDFRAFLDPANQSASSATVLSWSQEKRARFLAALQPEHFQRILSHALRDGTQSKAEPLTFSRLRFTDPQGAVRLQDVSGYLLPGEVVGIMAAPDAGASTLLDLLSGKALEGRLEGSIRYNDRAPGIDYRKSVGHVDQADLHLALLTVEETLFFSARLRLPASIPDELVRFRVQTVLALLGLAHVKDSLVGDAMVKGISGGQMRRLSVGVELTAGHSVLLADLPTNGLDSATAFELVRTFHHMVRADLSLMATVVQAGPELFQLFHRVLVMAKGSIIYSGPPSLAEAYFRSVGFVRPKSKSVPQFLEELSAAPEAFYHPTVPRNPVTTLSSYASASGLASFKADSKWLGVARTKQFYKDKAYSLRVTSPEPQSPQQQAQTLPLNSARVEAWSQLNEAYSTSVFYADVRQTLGELNKSGTDNDRQSTELAVREGRKWKDQFNSTFWVQFRENLIRQAKLTYRNRSSWLHIWMQSCIIGFMLGSLFYTDQLDDTTIGLRSRVGLYFYMTILISFNSFVILPVILGQRGLFYHQVMHKFFHPVFYYAAFIAVQLVVVVVDLMILLLPVWGLSGLAGFPLSGAFWFGFFMLLTTAFTARNWIIFICYAVPSEIIATTVLTVSFYLFALLSGEFIPEPQTVAGWRWAFNLSFVYWALQGLVMNDYLDAEYTERELGWQPDDEWKWTSYQHVLYFLISFSAAAIVTLTFVSWSRAPVPSASDFTSLAKKEEIEDDEGVQSAINQGEAVVSTEEDGSSVVIHVGGRKDKAAALPPRMAYLEFKDLNYTVTLPSGEQRQLLSQVYGYARPGRLVALMGKSGAGKSTLLDVLAGKKTGGVQAGSIAINGRPKDDASFSHFAAYVEQFDSHDPLSTVREAVLFSARLRLPRHLTLAELNAKVDNVLDLLNMRGVEHAIIGFPGMGGISLELRKKLTIAVEVVAEPALLFLDEPTTGLDSHSAANVMAAVRSLAASISVICTIHQPPSSLVAYFQDVLLIEAGRVVYFGDIQSLPPFLHSVGAPSITPGRNVSDYALEIISDKALFENKSLADLFLASPFAEHTKQLRAGGMVQPGDDISKIDLSSSVNERAPFLTQLTELTKRFYLTSIRSGDALMVRYAFALIFGFVVGTVFTQLGYSQRDGPKRLSAIFFSVGHFLFSASSFFPAIFMNRVLYFRESTNRLYGPLAYFLARLLGDLPHILLEVLVPTLMIYFIVDLSPRHHSAAYGYFFWACLAMRFAGILFTQLVASVIAAPDFAYSVLATTMYLMFVLTGFFIPYSRIPVWWRWLTQLDFLKFGLQFLAVTEYKDQLWTCDPTQAADVVVVSRADADAVSLLCGLSNPIATFPNPADATGATVLKCAVSCGYEMLDQLGVKTSVDWQIESFAILHAYAIFFALCGYLALKYINHVQR